MKRHALQLIVVAALTSTAALGQITCAPGTPAASHLICQFPFATGALANSSAANGTSAQGEAAALDLAVATQLNQLPLATASAGTVVAYRNGVPETFNSLGPILVDRAQPIGANRVFIGATGSQYVFNQIDGQKLSNLPFYYSRQTNGSTTEVTESIQGSMVVNQFVIVFTYGLSSRADMSFIVPITRISQSVNVPGSTEYVFDSAGKYLFSTSGPAQFSTGSASGAGDGEASFKYAVYMGEHAAVSTGAIFRAPTGVAENFLGSGAWGFNPYIVYSFLGKVSPHFKAAYQWNTATELNNPTFTSPIYASNLPAGKRPCGTGPNGETLVCQGNQGLPGGVQYDFGADWAISRRFTAAADLLGSQFLNTQRLILSVATIPTTPSTTAITTTNQPSSYSVHDVSTGLKWNPGGNVVFSVNLLTQINNDGLHARPTPLIGLAYKF